MIPGRSIETVHPCGIVAHGPEPIDLCAVCAMDCPLAKHERTCRGGCAECTCKDGGA